MSRKLNLMWWVRGGLLEETTAKPGPENSILNQGIWVSPCRALEASWVYCLSPKSETMSDATCVIWGWHNCSTVTPKCNTSLQQMTSPDFPITQPHTHPTTQLPLSPPPSSPQQREESHLPLCKSSQTPSEHDFFHFPSPNFLPPISSATGPSPAHITPALTAGLQLSSQLPLLPPPQYHYHSPLVQFSTKQTSD